MGGGESSTPNLSICSCIFMAKQLCNFAQIMAHVANCDCHTNIGALQHSMLMHGTLSGLLRETIHSSRPRYRMPPSSSRLTHDKIQDDKHFKVIILL